MNTAQPTSESPTAQSSFLVAIVVGLMVAVGLGAYGAVHPPGTVAINVAGFSSFLAVKSWLATLTLLLAIVQLVTALKIYGKLRGTSPTVNFLHRWSGRAAVAASLPVAAHCLYIAGFQVTSPRALLHSIAGCFFYGVFTIKMLALSDNQSPGWALPVFGGAAFAALTVLWATSSLWFFTTFGVIF
ncbi:MAG TPA: DUF6529 family protein [Aeromicrobium sp.]|nr:DUF6529 family protein [Aeromicrobium sp.]